MSGFWSGYICGFLTPVLMIGLWAIFAGYQGYMEQKRKKTKGESG